MTVVPGDERNSTTEPGKPAAVRARVVISGLVQGVFFRDFTRCRAREFRLTGWVCNLSDGRVEAIAEGPKDIILTWVELLHKGPPGSRVDDVAVDWPSATGEFESFEVRYSSGSSISK
jgi:acylphosphatase